MSLGTICLCATVAIGVIVGLVFHRRLGRMGLPICAIFVLAIDPQLYYFQVAAAAWLRKAGAWEAVARHPLWRPFLAFLSVALFAFLAWALVYEAKQLKLAAGRGGSSPPDGLSASGASGREAKEGE
jgi:hypothetical protein